MATKRELELERQALLLEMAGKIDFIYNILSQATIGTEEKKNERKNSKKTKKSSGV